ncbi:efflux RND transporter permease subunit [Hydrocarboniphaga sp.]|jgi:predicted RND superfamily exporter protein|uniref:efflux RND transporter permease subunit n=1 Tax=Hydrocarboniphaga sp. TaxID=2033016 RepID=UPI002AB83EF3|nr:MMPL family transporter [Hydrocarboniphaga sp.]MDZ4078442.1 efflux RND transporter permease subunit [Hydrocarboniphaga sp.]
MDNIRAKIARWVIEYRAAVGLFFIAITTFFAMGMAHVDIRTIFADLLPTDDPFVQTYADHPNFGNPLTVTIMIKRSDGQKIYNAETLQKVWDLTRDVDLINGVDHDRIISITTEKANYAEATPFGIEMQPLMGDHVPTEPQELIDLQRKVELSPMARTYLISSDETATLIRAGFHERELDYGKVFNTLQDLTAKAADGKHTVRLVGQPILTGWVYQLQGQTYAIFAVTLALLIAALVFYMRNVTGVTVPIVCSLVAAIWGFGLVGWLGSPIEPLLMVVPLLLVARSFSHCIQYTERYYEIYGHLRDREKASEATLSCMMAPSVLGIMTDIIAIFVIGIAPIPAMQRFALFCGMWAVWLIPTGVIMISILLCYLPAPKNIDSIVGGEKERGIHKFQKNLLTRMSSLVHGPKARITAMIVFPLSILGIYVSTQIAIGNPVEGSNLLWQDSEFNVGVKDINDHFPGVNSLEIILEAKDPDNVQRRAARTAEAYKLSKAIQRGAESSEHPPRISRSFSDIMEEGSRLYSGGHPAWLPLDPVDRSVNAAGTAVAFGQNPVNFSDMTDFQFQHSTVSLFYRDNKQATVDGALETARAVVAQLGEDHQDVRIRLASGTIALQEASNRVVERYHWILVGLCCVAIFIIATYAYRSAIAALILLIPTLLSNFLLLATMHMMGIGLDINSVMVTVLGVGVGIDYGIYLLSRICEEYSHQGEDWGRAISEAMTTTGKAIMFTATIMLIGILPWYFLSDLKFMADMGLLLAAIMLINMVLALIVLPLLVWLIKPRFVTRTDLMVGEGIDLDQFKANREAEERRARSVLQADAVPSK